MRPKWIEDLKRLGMPDATLVVWSGEFGRTAMSQANKGTVGRDHPNKSMSMWLTGVEASRVIDEILQ
jgi:uncharacterized protein (DUF1501 family)